MSLECLGGGTQNHNDRNPERNYATGQERWHPVDNVTAMDSKQHEGNYYKGCAFGFRNIPNLRNNAIFR